MCQRQISMTWRKDKKIKKLAVLTISYVILNAGLFIIPDAGAANGFIIALLYGAVSFAVMNTVSDRQSESSAGEYMPQSVGEIYRDGVLPEAGTCGKTGIFHGIKAYVCCNRIRRTAAAAAALMVLLGFSFLISAALGGSNIPVDRSSLSGEISFRTFANAGILIFRHVLVPALCEELYFRKVFFITLKDGCGIPLPVSSAVSSLLFAAMHGAGAAPAAFAFVSGFFLSLLLYLTDSAAYCCAVHFIYNLIAFAAAVI